MKLDKHIEIVRTDITRLSSMSRKSAHKIQTTLRGRYSHVDITTVSNRVDLELLVQRSPDLVFLGLKRLESGTQDEADQNDIWLADFLDEHRINYTGSQEAAIRLDFDKAQAKTIVQQAGLRTAKFFTARPGQYDHTQDLPISFPLFIKPLSTGGGNGIGDDSVVHNFVEFQQRVESIYVAYGASSLVEQYLDGREFTVAIFDSIPDGTPLVMPIEIITEPNHRGDRILGSRVKVEDNELILAVNDTVLRNKICTLALDVYNLLEGRDLGRIDIRLDADGEPHFIEVNFVPAPGTRYFAGACFINCNMDYESVITNIVELGLSRVKTVTMSEPEPHSTYYELAFEA